ncbi:hypothetical protein [Actinocorallia sp. A-T 12471]|uniref:hypothetical protein n=1 Tax=Actinocorallia sp. A-T 12471 TaxID=3089813 RepID=UPI0029CF43A8|nr:hypothetical protein [Actinocorallia sp. A-T 12471]MDX6738244.1 hypothetical protein [Actinocorallia sp. A-T 12471]
MSGPDDTRSGGAPDEVGVAHGAPGHQRTRPGTEAAAAPPSPAASPALPADGTGAPADPAEGPPAAPWWAPVIPPADPAPAVGVLAAPVPDALDAAPSDPEASGDFLTGTIVPKGPEIPPAEATITGEIPRWAAPAPDSAARPAESSGAGLSVVGMASRPAPPPAEPVAEAGPEDVPTPPRSARHGRRRRGRVPLYVALALVPTLAVAALAYAVVTDEPAPPAAIPTVTATVTAPAPEPADSPPASGVPAVDSVDTDPEALTLEEVFPDRRITLEGRTYAVDRKSLNLRCDYAAAGGMSRALIKNDCQMVVRSTFVSGNGRTGVTVGVVAMPSKRVAINVQKAGSPARKGNWFIGLPGKRTKQIGDSGGFAASTTYGRYILYVYVRHLEGRKPAKADQTYPKLASAFITYVNAPLRQR